MAVGVEGVEGWRGRRAGGVLLSVNLPLCSRPNGLGNCSGTGDKNVYIVMTLITRVEFFKPCWMSLRTRQSVCMWMWDQKGRARP